MQIDRPPGLLRRRAFPIDRGRFVVQEDWGLSVPGCPMIANPWLKNPLQTLGDKFVRQVEMTAEEFAASCPDLFG